MLTINQRDPTQTTVLRTTYSRDMASRFKVVRNLIVESVVSNDAVRIGTRRRDIIGLQSRPLAYHDLPVTDAQKILAFVEWLKDLMEIEILEGSDFTPGHWQNAYVREAYIRGLRRADQELRKIGLDIPAADVLGTVPLALPGVTVPINDQALQVLYLSNFNFLEGATERTVSSIRSVLAHGILEGINPREMARRMTHRIDIGLREAERIARTEIIRSFNEAALNRYEMLGVEGVTAEVEFSHSNDERVCIRCRVLGGQIFTIQDARGRIPIHPNCRCTWLPRLRSMS